MTTRFTIGTGAVAKETGTSTYNTPTTNMTTIGTTSIIYITQPTNGMAQFKGLTTSTN